MHVLLRISLRNLLRQKRRNILLGTAMAFGTMILILAGSFSHGISDVLFNKIVVYVAGHVSVSFTQDGNVYKQVFHDGDRIVSIVKKTLPDVTQLEEAIGIFSRAIGNGKADNVIMVGVDLKGTYNISQTEEQKKKAREEYKQNFKMIEGDFLDLTKAGIENPVAVSVEKAKYLNIKKGDILRVRFMDINGQNQAARLTVVALFKPANTFMSMPVFLEVNNLKQLAGYGPHDIGQLYLRITDAKKFAVRDADKLHDVLKPKTGLIAAIAATKTSTSPVSILGIKSDSTSRSLLRHALSLTAGDSAKAFNKEAVMIASPLASVLHITAGDTCTVTYTTKYDPREVTLKLAITGVFTPAAGQKNNIILINEKSFFATYYDNWPKDAHDDTGMYVPKSDAPYFAALCPEWILLDRCRTTDDVKKLNHKIASSTFKGATIDVESMYEMASDVLKLEAALNMITFAAVMILFFIILIGVINTLRMTVRERTREIGTIRAIGMQKKDVRLSFLLETFFLSLFSALAGTLLAFIVMGLLSLWTINAGDNPLSMLLVNGHLHFIPTATAVGGYILLIVAIAVFTAYFPARKAANMRASDALRHYE